MKLGKPLKLLLTVLVTGIVGLLLAEAATRILFPATVPWQIKAQLEGERNALHVLRPDATFHHVGDGRFHLDFPPHSYSGAPRIMIVGDSFAMAEGVEKDRRFGNLLQTNLGSRVVVDVLATSSYSPVIYRNIVRSALATNSYRAVAVFIDQTDPADDLIYQNDLLDGDSWLFNLAKMQDRYRVLDDAYGALLQQLDGWMKPRQLAIYNVLNPLSIVNAIKPGDAHYRYVCLAAARTGFIQMFAQEPAVPESRQMEAVLTTHIDQIVAMCREHKVPLFLAANPWEAMCSPDPKHGVRFRGPFPIENRLEKLLKDRYASLNGVYVIPLTQAFRAEKDPSSLFLNVKTEIHWNASCHVIVERALRKELLAKLPGL